MLFAGHRFNDCLKSMNDLSAWIETISIGFGQRHNLQKNYPWKVGNENLKGLVHDGTCRVCSQVQAISPIHCTPGYSWLKIKLAVNRRSPSQEPEFVGMSRSDLSARELSWSQSRRVPPFRCGQMTLAGSYMKTISQLYGCFLMPIVRQMSLLTSPCVTWLQYGLRKQGKCSTILRFRMGLLLKTPLSE